MCSHCNGFVKLIVGCCSIFKIQKPLFLCVQIDQCTSNTPILGISTSDSVFENNSFVLFFQDKFETLTTTDIFLSVFVNGVLNLLPVKLLDSKLVKSSVDQLGPGLKH